MESRGGGRLLSLSLCPCLFGAFFLGLGLLPHKARQIAFLVRVATNGGVELSLSLSLLMRFWRGEVMPVNEEELVWLLIEVILLLNVLTKMGQSIQDYICNPHWVQNTFLL